MLAFIMAQGGAGLYIYDGGVANLDGCQVYENNAGYVRACLSPLPGFPPAPRWNVTWCSLFLQYAGGLRIDGTATLIDSNVYSNKARVGARFEPS